MTTETRIRAEHLGPEVRRPLVLDAALEVWIEHGYAGTTMARIAKAANVSKPVLYACYAHKDEALRALMSREEERLVGAAQDALPESIDLDDVGEVMRTAYEAFFRATLEHPASWRVVFDAPHVKDPVITTKVNVARALITGQLTALLAHHLESMDRVLPERTVRLYAQNLIALAEANAATLLQNPGEWDPAELAQSVTDLVLTSWL
ncbi:AcrR family transcriptional regulator [Aeromicrobium panaciterrae]|uniref:AcrR family transcriptional regulator n=1 Tax=Aeromicrobium panaciterrae TaxID=363861 RepID=A0ABU1UQ86_9ACTN|nr:helix-turn-helix domain-containing protein [Aeromicrobium panaciterrae]MDR7087332.1 AcrR family transcriptional regulator [Aeromicrobium panaciterrae]